MLQVAVKKDPKFVQALSTLGSAYLRQGKIEESIECSKKAVDIAPDFAVAHNNLAIAYLEKGEFKKAVEHCDKAVEFGFDVHPNFLKELEAYRSF